MGFTEPFVPAQTFGGSQPGYHFTMGAKGLGYYKEGEQNGKTLFTNIPNLKGGQLGLLKGSWTGSTNRIPNPGWQVPGVHSELAARLGHACFGNVCMKGLSLEFP